MDERILSSWINSRLLINDSPAAKSPFKDLRLRQALNIAIDRSRMGQQIYQGYFQLAIAGRPRPSAAGRCRWRS